MVLLRRSKDPDRSGVNLSQRECLVVALKAHATMFRVNPPVKVICMDMKILACPSCSIPDDITQIILAAPPCASDVASQFYQEAVP